MNDFYIGLTTTAVIIIFLELFKTVEKRLISAFTLAVIPFIYIGFSWADPKSLVSAVLGVAFFLGLAYWGYRKNFNLIIIGLVLHGIWDVIFPFFSSEAPEGYDIFCITIDLLLALYFYFRVSPRKLKRLQS